MSKHGNFSAVGVGLMSGTSGDGVDLCCVKFSGNPTTENWEYEILDCKTIQYSAEWKKKLSDFDSLSGYGLIRLHFSYGHLLGKLIQDFIEGKHVDFVASHGHTVFHKPEDCVTFQMGDGETIATYLNQPLVTSFRYKDVALGGQGAPIVPFAEKRIFANFDVCINLGGICNIAIGRYGFDVAPCNMALNYLAHLHDPNTEYDDQGKISQSGTVIKHMLEELNALPFYKDQPPKSLGREWFDDHVMHIIEENKTKYPVSDLMRTFVEHIAHQIALAIHVCDQDTKAKPLTMLLTGGGAFNTYLVQRISAAIEGMAITAVIKEASKDTIEYKEAIIMAFLGMYTLLGQQNIQSSGTGAKSDSVSGSVHWPTSWNKSCDFWINQS